MDPETSASPLTMPPRTEGGEYNPDMNSRPDRSAYRGSISPGRRLRRLFFCLASLWGFIVGCAGLAIGLDLRGHQIGAEDPVILLTIVTGAVLAVVGGAILAAAYREARRRISR